VLGDLRRGIRQVAVRNLVANAVKFTSGGGVAPACRPRWRPAGLDISVTDSGAGISRTTVLATLFQAYAQGGKTVARRQRLAPAWASRSARSSPSAGAGGLDVESRVGQQGSTFTLRGAVQARTRSRLRLRLKLVARDERPRR
jgi:light-regulated signal transduction histidine kinase (bacteriophytochrome)